jgi:hypothetical protein
MHSEPDTNAAKRIAANHEGAVRNVAHLVLFGHRSLTVGMPGEAWLIS